MIDGAPKTLNEVQRFREFAKQELDAGRITPQEYERIMAYLDGMAGTLQ